MSQYKVGTATVNTGSAIVTGSGTSWLSNVNPGDGFTVAGTGVPYAVGSVDSDTQITLTESYAGADGSGIVYAINTGFTSNFSLPEMSQGDIETATTFTRAMRLIDGAMLQVGNLSLQGTVGVYGSVSAGETATVSGEYFFVELGGNELKLYRNDSGSGTLVGTYPLLEDIQAEFDAKVIELQAQQDAFQADHVRLSRSLSKTPDIGDTLRLDFATNGYGVGSDLSGIDQAVSLLDLVTFTRPDPGTYYGADRDLKTAAIDEPRLTYDPETGEALGLLAEEDRTNLLWWSEDFSNAAWSKNNITVTAAAEGFEISPTDTNSRLYQSAVTVSAGSNWFYVSAKANSSHFITLRSPGYDDDVDIGFDLLTGTAEAGGVIIPEEDGWYLCAIPFSPSADLTGDPSIYVATALGGFAGDVGNSVFLRRTQSEPGGFITSYIKTEGGPAPRSGDKAKCVLGAEWSPSEWTVIVDFVDNGNLSNGAGVLVSSNSQRLLYSNGGGSLFWFSFDGGTAQGMADRVIGQRTKIALSYKNGVLTSVQDGAFKFQRNLDMDSVTQLILSDRDGNEVPEGAFIYHGIYSAPRALTTARLQEITAP